MMKRHPHTFMQPWYIKHNGEEIRVNLTKLDHYFKTGDPYFMHFQRYIVGRPNLLSLPLYCYQYDKSFHWQAGAEF